MDDDWRLIRCGEQGRRNITKTEIVLDRDNLVIGRNVEPKYRLDCVNISRQHACLRFCNGIWDISDLRSHNGVFVNGVKITPLNRVILKEDDIIGFGKPAARDEDVFVFILKKNSRVAIKKELPDQSTEEPRRAPPSPDVIQLSDDDDDVVTPARRLQRNIPGTSPQHSSVPGAPLPNGSVAPALKQEKVRNDSDQDSSGPRVLPKQVSTVGVASMQPKVEVNHGSTSVPQQTPVIGRGAMAPNIESCEAYRTSEIGTGFLASTRAQRVLSLQTPVNVSLLQSGAIAVPSTDNTRPVGSSSLMRTGQDPPLRALGTSIKREEPACTDQPAENFVMCLPTDVPRPIKQDPEGAAGEEISASTVPAFCSHISGQRNIVHLENGFGNGYDNSDRASPASSKTEMHLMSSTSRCQQEEDRGDLANVATFNAEVPPEESEAPHVHTGDALDAQSVMLCAETEVVKSRPSGGGKNTMPTGTTTLTAADPEVVKSMHSCGGKDTMPTETTTLTAAEPKVVKSMPSGGGKNTMPTGTTTLTAADPEVVKSMHSGGGKNTMPTGTTTLTAAEPEVVKSTPSGGGKNTMPTGTTTLTAAEPEVLKSMHFGGGKNTMPTGTTTLTAAEPEVLKSMHSGGGKNTMPTGTTTLTAAEPEVVKSMHSGRGKNIMPTETTTVTAVSETKLQNASSVASSCALRKHTTESRAAIREHETENDRNPLGPEHEMCRQGSGTVLNNTECISSKRPVFCSLSILVKPCSVVVEKLEDDFPPQSIFEGRQNVEEDSSEDDDDVLPGTVCPEDMPFSQEDQIITISSDSEDDADIVAEVKREPEDMEEAISNNADVDDNSLWANHCLSNLPEETGDCVPPPVDEDRELEKRLVWNESEPQLDEVTSTEERQPENDFFPVLSQSFDDEPAPAKKSRSSVILVEPPSIPSSSTHTGSAHTGNKLTRSPKKKAGLRASMIMAMKKNRIPITGFKKKNWEVLQDPSSVKAPEDRKTSCHKSRFKSRTALLLDTHSDAENTLKKKKPLSPPVHAVHPPPKVQACYRSNAPAESARCSSMAEGACASGTHTPPESTFQVPSEPCSSVPSFKKFVRVSRVTKPLPVPVVPLVPPKRNGVPTSPLPSGPCGSPPIERTGAELAPAVRNRDPVTWLPHGSPPSVERMELDSAEENGEPVIPPGSPSTIEVMELDSAAQDKEAFTGLPSRPPLGSPPGESMDVDTKRRVRFYITEPSNRTDEERAEFKQRVSASLKKKKLEASQRSKANLGMFIAFILGWKVPWLKEQQASSTPPPLLDMDKFRSKRTMYSSLDEYKLVHFQFLCLEVWQSVFRSWKEYFSLTSRMTFNCAVGGDVCPPGDVTILSCVVLVTQEQMQRSLYPVEGHLVRLDLRLKEQRHAAMPVFGFVMQHRFHRDARIIKASVPAVLQKSYVDGCVQVALKIQVRTRPQMLDFSKTQRLTVVSKITPTLRQMEAVSELEQSMFVDTIVRPNTHHFWCRKGHPLRANFEGAFSEEQREVISSVVAATRAPGNDTRIVLLHGPPGTGKTHTIIGMVTELLRSSSKQTMLIVAPSNTAVDEIARRLLAHRAWQAKHATPTDMMLKAVRVGQDNMVHRDVRGICLTELLQKNIQREEAEHCRELEQVITGLERQMRSCEEKKRQLTSSAYPDVKTLRRLEFQLGELQAQIQKAKESKGKRRHFGEGGGRQPRNMNERKLAILRGAHVVLSTINSCRSRLLEEAFGRTSPCTFSCVLVDEATQCTEVEALLCLQYKTSKLILVGDPMQLPATVLSHEAVEHGFQESLFERFYNYLKLEAGSKPIFALSEQRRMHSEICQFPSQNFYNGKLRPIAGLDEAYASFPLTPYLVFNIADSPEASEDSGMSWLNRGEAAFVARLCRAIFDIVGGELSLGIITPYQAQKSAIVEQLFRLLPGAHVTCDVNTVDSFQGQERDVVIMSCVRAHHPKGHIGFVADARRLNVAITRAKKALFICGHLDSLKDTKEWGALVSDAKDRSKVRDVSANCSTDLLADSIRKPRSFLE